MYERRPWTRLYTPGLPRELELEHDSMLAAFEDTAARIPDRAAIRYFDAVLTYRELDEMSDALAVALQAEGLQPGGRLAIYLQNVPQFVVALLAAWKAGGIAVPVNPMLKRKELTALLADSGAGGLVALESLWDEVARDVAADLGLPLVITTSELDFLHVRPRLLEGSAHRRVGATHDLLELVERHRGAHPAPARLAPRDTALLTYTSGTTGPPKGAMNSHANLVFNAQTYREWVGLGDEDVVLGVAPFFHITGLVGHVAVALLTGMTLLMGYRFDADTMLELAERHGATFTVGSITAFIALMNAPSADRHALPRLRKVLSGGAPIPPATVEAFERKFGAYIHNIYGLTETTSPSHCVPFGRRAPVDPSSGALSVGVPIFGTVVRVVDEHGSELPPGRIGEFVTSGPQVVSGYWNKPEETDHALPAGALRTGDVGFMDEEGWFYLVDRKKDQINVSGYKVWPREVEDVLYGHAAVREAAVVGVPDTYRGETVKAFVSLKPGEQTTEAALIAFCKERMAAYKYPRAIEVLTELPKTASGKILRRELRDGLTDRTT